MKEEKEKKKQAPAYLQIYRQIRQDIWNHTFSYGSRLPSKRVLAEKCGVSVITIEHAYSLLEDEGYIEAKERSGFYVIFRKDAGFAGISELPEESPVIIPEVLRENDEYPRFPFTVLSKTMRSILSDYEYQVLDRSPNEGTWIFRTELSRYLARSRNLNVSPEQIIIGAGSEYLYSLIIGLLGHDRAFALETPSYQMIETVYKNAGVHCITLPLGKNGIQSAALANCNADILQVTPYRSFPSGVTASASKRHEYLVWASQKNRWLIEDDYGSEFSVLRKTEDTLFSLSERENVIYLNTFSKSISPSLRVGYMILPPRLLPVFQKKLGAYSCTVSTVMQYALARLLKNGDFERHINRVRRAMRKKRKENAADIRAE